jgi:hypothetical protein
MARSNTSTEQSRQESFWTDTSAEKSCVICCEKFTRRDPRQKTCGKPECQAAIRAQWREEHREEHRVHRDPEICKYCHDTFIPYGRRSDHCKKPACITAFETDSARQTRAMRKALQPPKEQRACEICQMLYTPRKSDQRTCAKPECFEELQRRLRKEKYDANKPEMNQKSREYCARQKDLAWRPPDWNDKPEGYRVIGGLLLSSSAYVGNAQICTIIDTLKMHCPYAESWSAALKKPECIKYLSRIRNWVHRPGKQGSVNPAENLAS